MCARDARRIYCVHTEREKERGEKESSWIFHDFILLTNDIRHKPCISPLHEGIRMSIILKTKDGIKSNPSYKRNVM